MKKLLIILSLLCNICFAQFPTTQNAGSIISVSDPNPIHTIIKFAGTSTFNCSPCGVYGMNIYASQDVDSLSFEPIEYRFMVQDGTGGFHQHILEDDLTCAWQYQFYSLDSSLIGRYIYIKVRTFKISDFSESGFSASFKIKIKP